MKAILDTSGWYAFVLGTDEFHSQADEFMSEEPDLVVPYTVFEELSALLHHREGKKVAIEKLSILRNPDHFKLTYLTYKEENEIWGQYQKSSNKIDYVDASLIVLSQKLDLPIFSFDSHFKKLGLNLVPLV